MPEFVADIISNCSPSIKDGSVGFPSISHIGDENEVNSRPLRVLMHPPLHTNPVSQQVDIRFIFYLFFICVILINLVILCEEINLLLHLKALAGSQLGFADF